jgi:hypothetical protein
VNLWALAFIPAAGLALLFFIAGLRCLARIDELTDQRNTAWDSARIQAEETERLHAAVQDGCRIMRAQLESQATDEGWDEVSEWLTENEA